MMWRRRLLRGFQWEGNDAGLALEAEFCRRANSLSLETDGNAGLPFHTQTGQRSGELAANSGWRKFDTGSNFDVSS